MTSRDIPDRLRLQIEVGDPSEHSDCLRRGMLVAKQFLAKTQQRSRRGGFFKEAGFAGALRRVKEDGMGRVRAGAGRLLLLHAPTNVWEKGNRRLGFMSNRPESRRHCAPACSTSPDMQGSNRGRRT